MTGVLDGVRVLDLGRYIAGPMCAAILGDLGADVIRVERLSGGDDRYQYLVSDAGDAGACFLQMNRNKRGITLDPMRPAGRRLLARLAASSDIVAANLPADTLRAMGLDYETLRAAKPDIILTDISAFGAEGPYANRVGFDGVGQAMSGAVHMSGNPGEPMKSFASWVDCGTALYAALGTLAALAEKARTGRGQQVSATLFGTATSFFNFMLIEQALKRPDRTASGNRAQSSGPADICPTRDGWIMFQTLGDGLFRRWAELIGEPEWLQDERFKTDTLRAAHGDILSERTRRWTSQHTTAEALERLAAARIPAGPVYSPQQVLDDPHAQATGMFTPVSYPGLPGPAPVMMKALGLSQTPLTLRRRPPTLSEHTDEVLAEIGLSTQDVAELRAQLVI